MSCGDILETNPNLNVMWCDCPKSNDIYELIIHDICNVMKL